MFFVHILMYVQWAPINDQSWYGWALLFCLSGDTLTFTDIPPPPFDQSFVGLVLLDPDSKNSLMAAIKDNHGDQ